MLLNYLIGVDITHVPYRGTGPAMQDLQGGRIDYLCEIVSTAKPQIDGGTVKPVAIMTKERSKALPNVPTGLEQGTPDLEAYTWNALFLPKGTPADVVKKLSDAALQAMKTPGVRERLEGLGAVIVSTTARRGISRPVPQGRDRKMGGSDQGQRRERGLARPRAASGLRTGGGSGRRMPEDQDQIERRPAASINSARRSRIDSAAMRAGDARAAAGHSNSISPLISCENPIPASVTVAWAGIFSFPLSLPSARAWRTAFSISRWAVTPSVLRNLRMLVLNTSSFI